VKRQITLTHEFVKVIPKQLADNTLYISVEYATVAHKCCCGCGSEVVTPLSPTDWQLTYDGVTISLWPSVGNWSFKCRSHYWIQQSTVRWAAQWSKEPIEAARAYDRHAKAGYYVPAPMGHGAHPDPTAQRPAKPRDGFWSWFSQLGS
jgi:hypothetical protein